MGCWSRSDVAGDSFADPDSLSAVCQLAVALRPRCACASRKTYRPDSAISSAGSNMRLDSLCSPAVGDAGGSHPEEADLRPNIFRVAQSRGSFFADCRNIQRLLPRGSFADLERGASPTAPLQQWTALRVSQSQSALWGQSCLTLRLTLTRDWLQNPLLGLDRAGWTPL